MDCPYPQCKRCKEAYDKLRTKLDTLNAENAKLKLDLVEAIADAGEERNRAELYREALEEISAIKPREEKPFLAEFEHGSIYGYNECLEEIDDIARTAIKEGK